MSLSDPTPSEDTKQSKMKKSQNCSSPEQTTLNSPSTSKGPIKIEIPPVNTTITDLPHAMPLQSTTKDGEIKIIQVPPNSIPTLVKLGSVPQLNIVNYPILKMTKEQFKSTNIKIFKPMNHVPAAPKKIPGPFLEIVPITPDNKVPISVAGVKKVAVTSSNNTSTSIATNQAFIQLNLLADMPNLKSKIINLPSMVPCKMVNLPSETANLPSEKANLPSKTENLLIRKENSPLNTENMTFQKPNIPSKMENLLIKKANSPLNTESLTSEKPNLPSKMENLVIKKANIPLNTENLIIQKANLPSKTENLPRRVANVLSKTPTIKKLIPKSPEKAQENNTQKKRHFSPVSEMEKKINKKIANLTSPAKKETKTAKEKPTVEGKPNNVPPKAKVTKKKSPRSRKVSKQSIKHASGKDAVLNVEMMYPADGFRDDIERLLEKCLHVFKLNFSKFCDMWKEMRFPCAFYERKSCAELAELSEELIHVAKGYMLAPNITFEENVAGLFLVYALLNHQPFAGFASLRLVPGDVPAVRNLEREAREKRRHDVLYVLGSVLIKGPCQCHVLEREVSLEAPIRKYFDGTVQMSSNMNAASNRSTKCVRYFKDLSALEGRYSTTLKKLIERRKGQEVLSDLGKRPAAKLLSLHQDLIPSRQRVDQNPVELINDILSKSKPEQTRSRLLMTIKNRAMASAVNPMRHLTTIDERREDYTSSSSEESDEEIKRSSRKPRVKGKGRSSATTLQELFGLDHKAQDFFVPEPSMREMPSLDPIDETDSSDEEPTSSKDTVKEAPNKKSRTVNNNSKKTKNKSPKPNRKRKNSRSKADRKGAKRTKKITASNHPDSDLELINDSLPAEDEVEVNVDNGKCRKNNGKGAKKVAKRKTNTDDANNLKKLFDEVQTQIAINMPTVAVDTFEETAQKEQKRKGVPKSTMAAVLGEASNINNKAINGPNSENPTRTYGEKRKKKDSPSNPIINANTPSSELLNFPSTSKGERNNIEDMLNIPDSSAVRTPNGPEMSSPRKTQNTPPEEETDETEPPVGLKRGVTLRVVSTFKKMGLLELADDR